MPACLELEAAFVDAWSDDAFVEEYRTVLREFAGRPTPVTPLARLGEHLGLRIFAKREDLAHTGSHKINNVIGQTLLTKRMGKRRVIAETGAGQHGVATATAAARLGSRVHRLHGRGRHRASDTQRLSHGAPGVTRGARHLG